jgi:hypothetical protein
MRLIQTTLPEKWNMPNHEILKIKMPYHKWLLPVVGETWLKMQQHSKAVAF